MDCTERLDLSEPLPAPRGGEGDVGREKAKADGRRGSVACALISAMYLGEVGGEGVRYREGRCCTQGRAAHFLATLDLCLSFSSRSA
jgi:hypothetical protein